MTSRALAASRIFLILAVLPMAPGGGALPAAEEPNGGDSRVATVGLQVPSYSARLLDDDESLDLRALRGRVVLLNFWATWCLPCRHEIPVLAALSEKHRDHGLEVLGVSLDVAGAEDRVRRLVAEQAIPYTVLLDQKSLASDIFALAGLPASFLVSRDGILLWQRTGPVLKSDPELEDAVAEALRGDGNSGGDEATIREASASISTGSR